MIQVFWILFALVVLLLGYLFYRDFVFDKRTNGLLDRLMARTYAEYRYYRDHWKPDIAEQEKLRAEARDERKVAAATAPPHVEEEPVDLHQYDEDWPDEQESK